MISRIEFSLDDTGYDVQTSVPLHGELHCVFWKQTAGDTGGSLVLSGHMLAPGGDTGFGFNVLSVGLQPNLLVFPRSATHDIDGIPDTTDTGTPAAPAPYLFSGDHLRAVLTPGAAATGKLYGWIKD